MKELHGSHRKAKTWRDYCVYELYLYDLKIPLTETTSSAKDARALFKRVIGTSAITGKKPKAMWEESAEEMDAGEKRKEAERQGKRESNHFW